MKFLYGTGNEAKIDVMRRKLAPLGIELIGLRDLEGEPPQVLEDGRTPLENARKKALAYYKAYGMPVFSCDSGLYFDSLPDEMQPGVHVRTVKGRILTDEEMTEYYAGLAKEYGDITARYRNAICLVLDETRIYEAMDEDMASAPFLLTSVPAGPIRQKGFPLDCISMDIRTKKYYYDMNNELLDTIAVEDGFLRFFETVAKGVKE